MGCPHCGQTHAAGVRFCPVTGLRIPASSKCPQCGQGIQVDWNVCVNCGHRLSEGETTAEQLTGRGKKHTWWFWAIIGGISALGLIAIYLLLSQITVGEQLNQRLSKITQFGLFGTPAAELMRIESDGQETRTATITLQPSLTSTGLGDSKPPSDTQNLAEERLLTEAAQTEIAQPTQTQTAPEPSDDPGIARGKIVFTCQILRNSMRNQVCMINADGSGWVRLTTEDSVDHTYPSFAPDGRSIIFAAEKGDDHQIYEMDLEGNQQQLTDLPFGAYSPAVSPDTTQIVFTGHDGRRQTIWLMDRDGSNPHQLTNPSAGDSFDPEWSPDGNQILFASDRTGHVQIFIMNTDGSDVRQLTDLAGLRGRSDWAPDGQSIATYIGGSWERDIILIGKEGETLGKITDGGNNLAPSYSPDGGWLAFTSYRDNYRDDHGCEIYIMRIDGSEVTRLTENNYCDWQPHWGP